MSLTVSSKFMISRFSLSCCSIIVMDVKSVENMFWKRHGWKDQQESRLWAVYFIARFGFPEAFGIGSHAGS